MNDEWRELRKAFESQGLRGICENYDQVNDDFIVTPQ